MRKIIYLIRVEGVNSPAICIDAKRFNRLVEVVAPFDLAVRVLAISRYDDYVTANDLRLFTQIFNHFKNKL